MDQNQQYQQPQQPQQPQYAPRPRGYVTGKFVDIVAKLASILVIVFLCLAAAACLYYLIDGIVLAAKAKSFQMFLNVFVEAGFSSVARYCFYAAVLALFKKVVK